MGAEGYPMARGPLDVLVLTLNAPPVPSSVVETSVMFDVIGLLSYFSH